MDGDVVVGGLDYCFEQIFDFGCHQDFLPLEVQDTAIPIFFAGWHQFPRDVWIAGNGMIYALRGWEDHLEIFPSILDFLRCEIQCQFGSFSDHGAETLHLTFEHQVFMDWDDALWV